MKKTKKITALLIGTMLTTLLFSGCGKKKEETETTETTEASVDISSIATMEGSAEDIVVISREGYVLSDLTGEWIDEKYDNMRPLCCMINNIKDALPQSGISQASITYEVLVEGGITRLMCIFDHYDDIEKLGSVRSARVPYIQIAQMYDGIFAHYGYSPTAQNMIEADPTINNLNGMTMSDVFFRTNDKPAPHNAYTNSDCIISGIERMGYNTEHNSNYQKAFNFNYKDMPLENGQPANKVTTAFSNYSTSCFEYNAEDGRYYRSEYGAPHIDAATGEQLSYKNVIVLLVNYYTETDASGYDYHFVHWDNGDAYYFTNGQYVKLKWNADSGVVKLYNEDGSPAKLNPGNTFVSVFDSATAGDVTIE